MSVKVKGLNEAIKALKQKGIKAERAIIDLLSDTATSIELDAKADAPSMVQGQALNIKQRIDKIVSDKGFRWNIGVQGTQDFDAYVEFGTGLSAKQIVNGAGYTPEMRAIAMGFFKNGLGTLRGRPYLFPNYIKHTANLVDEMEKEVTDALR